MPETGNFKSRLFGGFDRKDVHDYITQLAAERNSLKEKCARLEAEADELHEKILEAERKTAEVTVNARAQAARELLALQNAYEGVRADMEVTAAHVRSELSRMGDGTKLLLNVLDKAAERFSELYGIVSDGGDVEEEKADDTPGDFN